MRYTNIDNITFTDVNGNPYVIKDMKEFDSYVDFMTIKISEDDMIDEIVSRRSVYGENQEALSYKVYEHTPNAERIYENRFDLTGIDKIIIPNESN